MDGSIVSLDAGCAMDLGGIAKGYASQQVADILRPTAFTSADGVTGRQRLCLRCQARRLPWNVGIQDLTSSG